MLDGDTNPGSVQKGGFVRRAFSGVFDDLPVGTLAFQIFVDPGVTGRTIPGWNSLRVLNRHEPKGVRWRSTVSYDSPWMSLPPQTRPRYEPHPSCSRPSTKDVRGATLVESGIGRNDCGPLSSEVKNCEARTDLKSPRLVLRTIDLDRPQLLHDPNGRGCHSPNARGRMNEGLSLVRPAVRRHARRQRRCPLRRPRVAVAPALRRPAPRRATRQAGPGAP